MLLDVFRRWIVDGPERPALVYFDTVLTYRELDSESDALAVALAEGDFRRGDRAALYLQNVPQYVISLLAIWKLGGIAVPVNPMLTPGEVVKLCADATPEVLIALDELHTPQLAEALGGTSIERVITTSALDGATAHDTDELRALILGRAGRRPPHLAPAPDDVAAITYTSGTTGKPKGAMNTHANVTAGGRSYCQWFGLGAGDSVLGIAPLFHVTGLSGHIATAITAGAPLVLCNRFHFDVVVDAVRRHRPTFTVGALTAFIALLESGCYALRFGDSHHDRLRRCAGGLRRARALPRTLRHLLAQRLWDDGDDVPGARRSVGRRGPGRSADRGAVGRQADVRRRCRCD